MKRWMVISFSLFLLPAVGFAAERMERTQGIIGILPLPEVFGNGPCDRFKAQDIELYGTPKSSTPIGRIYVSKPWTFPPAGGCEGLEVSASVSGSGQKDGRLPTREFSYETPGAIVTKREGQWYKIALQGGYAWVRTQDEARYLPVEKLLKDSLTYLRGKSRLPLLQNPGQSEAIWSPGPDLQGHLPVKVLAFRELSGQLWVRVRLLEVEPCSGERTTVVPVSGWLPFHDESGTPVIWFYSRGC